MFLIRYSQFQEIECKVQMINQYSSQHFETVIYDKNDIVVINHSILTRTAKIRREM